MKRKSLLATLWLIGGLLAVFFLLRTFVANVYRVESGSMEPTIHGGAPWSEWVLVRYDGNKGLKRFDLAVVYKGDGKPIVKRVVGLPGENVQIRGGDLFIDGSRLRPTDPRPLPVTLFDSRVQDLSEEFELDSDQWREQGSDWVYDSRDRGEAGEANGLKWNTSLDDGYRLPDGSRVHGSRIVNDGAVAIEFQLLDHGGELRIDLREDGDCFRATVEFGTEPEDNGQLWAVARIERLAIQFTMDATTQRAVLLDPELLVEEEFRINPEGLQELRFSNIDNALVLVFRNAVALQHSYSENRAVEGLPVVPGKTIGAQIALGGEGVHLRVHSLQIARDMYWTSRGEFAIERPISLGPREYFLLGDHSVRSLDGRTWGATQASDVLGRPTKIVWPRERSRKLKGASWTRIPAPDPAE